ncbi:hypothetical protein BU15DRAFT_74560 [Melanogaster broomeanus]|nr:hypothetical protein BU15DRAFT_74560 [Melanogaster broomeanus]
MNAGFQGLSASLSVDGGEPVTTTIAAPSPPSYQTPNVSLFSIQSLSYAWHSATVNVLDWNDGPASFYFDYALINETYAAILPTSTSQIQSTSVPLTSSSSSAASSSSHSSLVNNTTLVSTTPTSLPTVSATSPALGVGSEKPAAANTGTSANLGVIVGSACGGLAVIIALVTAVILLKRRKTKVASMEDSHTPHPYPPSIRAYNPPPPPLSPPPRMDDKQRLRLTHHEAALFRARRPAEPDGETSDFQFLTSAEAPWGVLAVSSSLSSLSRSNEVAFSDVIDCRREDGRPSSLRTGFGESTASNTAPPDYQTFSSAH